MNDMNNRKLQAKNYRHHEVGEVRKKFQILEKSSMSKSPHQCRGSKGESNEPAIDRLIKYWVKFEEDVVDIVVWIKH